MNCCNAVRHQILAFEKRHGYKPKMLILAELEFREKFFSEIYEYTMKTENVDFKTPGQFCGVSFEWENIELYAGSCRWMIIGGRKP